MTAASNATKSIKIIEMIFYEGIYCTLDVINEPEVPLSDPQVRVVELVRDLAVDHVPVVADHGPLLEPGALGAFEGHPAAMTVAQVVRLEEEEKREKKVLVPNTRVLVTRMIAPTHYFFCLEVYRNNFENYACISERLR